MQALEKSGALLQCVHQRFTGHHLAVLTAVKTWAGAYVMATEEVKACRDVVLQTLKTNGMYLRQVPKYFLHDRHVVFAAVSQNGRALALADAFHTDYSMVLCAVKTFPLILWQVVATRRFASNTEVARAAVATSPSALRYVHRKFRSDRKLVVAAVSRWASSIKYASNALRRDPDVVRAFFESEDADELSCVMQRQRQAPHQSCFPRLKSAEEWVEALKRNSCLFKFAPPEVQQSKDAVMAGVSHSVDVLRYVIDNLIDPDVVLAAGIKDVGVFDDDGILGISNIPSSTTNFSLDDDAEAWDDNAATWDNNADTWDDNAQHNS
jgi:hypothetical protein